MTITTCSARESPLRTLFVQVADGRSKSDASAVLDFDIIKDLANRTPFDEMAQFDRQVLLQRLVVALGLVPQRRVNVVRDVTDQDMRHAYIMLATGVLSKEDVSVADGLRETAVAQTTPLSA